jgi:hypothetical protein
LFLLALGSPGIEREHGNLGGKRAENPDKSGGAVARLDSDGHGRIPRGGRGTQSAGDPLDLLC